MVGEGAQAKFFCSIPDIHNHITNDECIIITAVNENFNVQRSTLTRIIKLQLLKAKAKIHNKYIKCADRSHVAELYL